jgi:hypothetical protein
MYATIVNANETSARIQPNSFSICGMYKPLVSVEITLGPNASPTVAPRVVRMPEVVASEFCAVVAM